MQLIEFFIWRNLEDKKIKAFYTIVESDIENEETIYTPEFKAELDQRQEDYKNGKMSFFYKKNYDLIDVSLKYAA
jgi:hypothetical protein